MATPDMGQAFQVSVVVTSPAGTKHLDIRDQICGDHELHSVSDGIKGCRSSST